MELVTVDIGGTHARFARTTVADGTIKLGEPVTLATADHASFQDAWAEYARQQEDDLPRAAALSIAAPVTGETIRLVNNPWVIERAPLAGQLGVDALTIVNDFGAVGHAVARLGAEHFAPIAGPDQPLPDDATITVIGPGTGLGIAHVWRKDGDYRVQATEGGHFSFAPTCPLDDVLLERLRRRYGRVSAERVAAGPGIVDIHTVIAAEQGKHQVLHDDKLLWQRGIAGEDAIARAAVLHFCRTLGAVAGDVALAQGGTAVVIAGGIGLRLRELLPQSEFAAAFCDKGRFAPIMAAMPVNLITHPQPGLFGAAAAFATEHPQ